MCRISSRLLALSVVALTFVNILSKAQVQTPTSSLSLDIHGQVRFTQGGAPAQNILVKLESYDSGGPLSEAFTDRSGKFRFSGLSAAQYTVRVHHSGFLDTQQQVDLQTASSGYVLLQLAPEDSRPISVQAGAGTINANVSQAAQREFDKGITALAAESKQGIAEAVRHFEKAVTLCPLFVEARLKLGITYMDLEEWDKAEKALQATLETEPRATNALFALSEIYLQENKTNEAEIVLLKGLQIDDSSSLGHLNLARVYWEKARYIKDLAQAKPALEKSYEEVKRALELNPVVAGAHLLKGNLLLRATRTMEALREFDEYLRLEPQGQFAGETRALVERIKKVTGRQSQSSAQTN